MVLFFYIETKASKFPMKIRGEDATNTEVTDLFG